jgi:hypothetical protein
MTRNANVGLPITFGLTTRIIPRMNILCARVARRPTNVTLEFLAPPEVKFHRTPTLDQM